MTIGKKLWGLALSSAALLVICMGLSAYFIQRLGEDLSDVGSRQLPLVRHMTLADMLHDGIRSTVMSGLYATQIGDESQYQQSLADIKEQEGQIQSYVDEIKKLSREPEISELVTQAEKDISAYTLSARRLLSTKDMTQRQSDYRTFMASFKQLEKSLGDLGELIEANSLAMVQRSQKNATDQLTWLFAIGVTGLLAGLGLSTWINRSLMKDLRRIIDSLSVQNAILRDSSGAAFESSSKLAASSDSQSAAAQQTASATDEVNAMVASTADNSQILLKGAEESMKSTHKGQEILGRMIREMDEIKLANEQVMSQVNAGNIQIKKIVTVISEIGEKTKVINDIVFQTKLLSFNASVEAARAGENGKGFAVVAEEVGNLATLSGKSAQEITAMLENGIKQVNEIILTNTDRIGKSIEGSTSKIDGGKRIADQCGEIYSQIVRQVEGFLKLSGEITSAVKEQKTGMGEIGSATKSFSDIAHEASELAHTSSEIASNVDKCSIEINELVTALNALIGSQSSSATTTPRASEPTQWNEKKAA